MDKLFKPVLFETNFIGTKLRTPWIYTIRISCLDHLHIGVETKCINIIPLSGRFIPKAKLLPGGCLPGGVHPPRWLLPRAVRILLECILCH